LFIERRGVIDDDSPVEKSYFQTSTSTVKDNAQIDKFDHSLPWVLPQGYGL